jgi:OmcA/MtrC family decaheme c-type cytochrome
VGSNGAATVTFQITDGDDVPLDLDGIYTEGAVSTSFVLAWLDETAPGQPLQYASYTTAAFESPTTHVTANQAAADTGGSFSVVDAANGIYTYTFGTSIAVANPKDTHTVGVWASRDFGGAHYVANTTFDFVPAGGAVVTERSIVETAGCNGCHNPLVAHGGDRRDTGLCVLCHTPQTTDPSSGNTLDFPVMVHKIHRGASLPNVLGGTPYQLIDDDGTVSDYSTVVYPQEIQRCWTCHDGTQSDVWKTVPARVTCGSCHDLTSFAPPPIPAGMTAHTGGPMADDSKCTVCHPPAAGLAGVATVHLTPLLDPASPTLTLSIASVEGTAPGQTPQVVFGVQENGAALDLLGSPLPYLAVTLAGPTTDYASSTTFTIQGAGATGTLAADGGAYRYTFPAPIPAGATGTYAFGLEGYLQPGGAGTPQFAAENPIAFSAVTDAAPVPRRTVVALSQCNACHDQFAAHGGERREVQYCSFCHNPNAVDQAGVARFEGATVTAQSLDLPVLIHRIHMGNALTQPYVVGGEPEPTPANPAGTPLDFAAVLYPGDRKACWACHAGATYTLPLPADLLPSVTEVMDCADPTANPTQYCDEFAVASTTSTPPTTAACTGCHDAPYVVAHAETNTAPGGVEACATCHGPGAAYDVQGVHAPSP